MVYTVTHGKNRNEVILSRAPKWRRNVWPGLRSKIGATQSSSAWTGKKIHGRTTRIILQRIFTKTHLVQSYEIILQRIFHALNHVQRVRDDNFTIRSKSDEVWRAGYAGATTTFCANFSSAPLVSWDGAIQGTVVFSRPGQRTTSDNKYQVLNIVTRRNTLETNNVLFLRYFLTRTKRGVRNQDYFAWVSSDPWYWFHCRVRDSAEWIPWVDLTDKGSVHLQDLRCQEPSDWQPLCRKHTNLYAFDARIYRTSSDLSCELLKFTISRDPVF